MRNKQRWALYGEENVYQAKRPPHDTRQGRRRRHPLLVRSGGTSKRRRRQCSCNKETQIGQNE
ncbi:MAG: hypothetical protein ACXAC5_01480 [Promethearchaeota archaeon]